MVKQILKILQQMLWDFWRVFEHFVDTRRYNIKKQPDKNLGWKIFLISKIDDDWLKQNYK